MSPVNSLELTVSVPVTKEEREGGKGTGASNNRSISACTYATMSTVARTPVLAQLTHSLERAQ